MDAQTYLTKSFLQCITKHLSSRPECRGVTYRLVLGKKDDLNSNKSEIDFSGYISFSPHVEVYHDRYSRKPCDKLPVEEHVILIHFMDELYAGRAKFSNGQIKESIKIHGDKIVPGIYEYQPSITNKRRRWVRVK